MIFFIIFVYHIITILLLPMPVLSRNKEIIPIPFEKPDLNQLIDEDSLPIKLFNLINQLDLKAFYDKIPAIGAPSYPPEDMVSVILLAFSEGIFSTRKMEEKCKRDLYYLFLTEQRKPDHSTIARFIKNYKLEIAQLSSQLTDYAMEKKIADFKTISIDGTKIAAFSSKRHSKRSPELEKLIKQLERKIAELLELVEKTDKKEEAKIKELEAEEKRLREKLAKTKQAEEELKKRKKEIKQSDHRENHQINIEEPDARMMPVIATNGYNIQLSVDTATGMIAAQRVTIARSDNHEFKPQHQKTEEVLGADSQREYLADSGYNSNDTLEYIEENNVEAYINDSKEKEKQPEKEELLKLGKRLTTYDFVYDKKRNVYICPDKKTLEEKDNQVYECKECEGCELRSLCCLSEGNKKINRTSYNLLRENMSEKVRQNGKKMSERKSVERVFGHMKWNLGMTKFHRKGIEGATVELNIMAMAINMLKIFSILLYFFAIRHAKEQYRKVEQTIFEQLEYFPFSFMKMQFSKV